MRLPIWTQRLLAVVFIGLAAICGIIEATHRQYKETGYSTDMHGGVPMGIPNDNCDNGKVINRSNVSSFIQNASVFENV